MNKRYNVKISGIGCYLPDNIVTNEDLHELYNTNKTWPETYLGIKERRWVVHEQSSDLGYMAALDALQNSNLSVSDIDLMIVATSTPDKLAPSTACIIAEKLNLTCPCFDINSVCSGFMYALNIATPLIDCGTYKNILIVATETYSKITDTNSRDCVYFGDGAGAIILNKSVTGWISTEVYSDGTGKDGFITPLDSNFIMDGKSVFSAGVENLPKAISKLLHNMKFNIDDIKYLVPHQPGIKMLQEISKEINYPFDRVITVMDKYANIAAASIPIALNECIKHKKLQNDDVILLASIGSGWTWGVGLIKYEK